VGEGVVDGRRSKGSKQKPEPEHLSRIIELLNERFGLKLTEADQLLFDGVPWVERAQAELEQGLRIFQALGAEPDCGRAWEALEKLGIE